MFKKTCFAVLIASSSAAIADDQTSLSFDLEANIPATRYYVEFENPSFGQNTQEMMWNQGEQKLDNVTTQLRALNNTGNIEAHLDDTAELVHDVDVAKKIPLTVSIDGKALPVGSTTPVEIVDAATNTEQKLSLQVSPTGTPTYSDGKYNGAVTINFDHSL